MNPTRCRVCRSPYVAFLWTDKDGCDWYGCSACGSHSNLAAYDPGRYGAAYIEELLADEGGSVESAMLNHMHNAEMFARHISGKHGSEFLDVGTAHGASQRLMKASGWNVHGFDVCAEGRPEGTVVAGEFRAELFPCLFDLVLCREVLEHVPYPHAFLRELCQATRPGGLLQLTTPRPMESTDAPHCYGWSHLALWDPDRLIRELCEIGFIVLESWIWERGQRHICRRPFALRACA